jgi:hypothetical protein
MRHHSPPAVGDQVGAAKRMESVAPGVTLSEYTARLVGELRSVKALLAAALTAVSLALAPAAHATPNDDVFNAEIDRFGIPISHREAWVEANAACTFLGEGHPVGALMVNLANNHPNWSAADVERFAGPAVAAYCPQYNPNISR